MDDRSLCRSVDFELLRAEETDDGLTIDGYAAVFNSRTTIDSWEGAFEEQIAPGAFRKSVRERTPIMQFDHGAHPLLGSLPLGRWDTVEEDARGLHVVGRLSDNWLIQPFRDAIRDGGVTGMSFRFSVVRDEWHDASGVEIRDNELAGLLYGGAGDRGPILRTLRQVKISEAGPVTWPAYPDTAVGVRSDSTVVDLDLRSARGRAELARAVVLIDRLVSEASTADTTTDVPAPAGPNEIEPHTTDDSAADHPAPAAEPVRTETSAGEHSSAAAYDRRARMRSGIHEVGRAMEKINRKNR